MSQKKYTVIGFFHSLTALYVPECHLLSFTRLVVEGPVETSWDDGSMVAPPLGPHKGGQVRNTRKAMASALGKAQGVTMLNKKTRLVSVVLQLE